MPRCSATAVLALSDTVAKRLDAWRAPQTEGRDQAAKSLPSPPAPPTPPNEPLLKPGATIGILGGGQLARMLALPAAPLGLRCHVCSPEKNSCAFDVVHAGTCAGYDDETALGRFAGGSTSLPMNSRTCRPEPPHSLPGGGR